MLQLDKQDNIEFAEFATTSGSYVLPPGGRFIFRGTTSLGTPTALKVVGGFLGTPGTGDYRVFDVTNVLVIAEITGVATLSPAILDLGTISHLPAGEAIWEVQLFRSAGGGGGNTPSLSSLQIQF